MSHGFGRGDDTTNLGFEQAFVHRSSEGRVGGADFLIGFESRSPATPEGVRVRIEPDNGEAWTGLFAGESDRAAVYATPDPDVAMVCVEWRCYFVGARTGDLLRETSRWPVVDVLARPDAGAMVIVGDWDVFVHRNGRRFLEARDSELLAGHGLRILAIDGGVLRGEGRFGDEWRPFELNLDTGDIAGRVR